mmetsp:Transcript_120841/g.353049  ORF Transcript_120841/g.353049 Transcript_120841/m.353049 type:complete len:308 (+) Transcript_120841:86-1009(+)
MMSRRLLSGAMLVLAAATDVVPLGDTAALIQASVEGSSAMQDTMRGRTAEMDDVPASDVEPTKSSKAVNPNDVLMRAFTNPSSVTVEEKKAAAIQMAKDFGKKQLRQAVLTKTPFGLGKMILNDKDKSNVHQCSDISSSLYCSLSQKVYGIHCSGWGGHSCLDASATCESITVEGICHNAINRLNISCLGWGGRNCLPPGAKANLIRTEALCKTSEAKLGIRSSGWGGSECFDKHTAACQKITMPGICNDASSRLGLDCAGWGGSGCLPKEAKCIEITAKHLCQTAQKRFQANCSWRMGGKCKDASV